MASRKITKQEQTAEQKRIAELEAQIAKLTADNSASWVPGWDRIEDDDYSDSRWKRTLPDKSAGEVVFAVKGDFVACFPNLRFSKGRPIPGFGGKRERWIGKDGKGGLRAYFKSKEFDADLVAVLKLAKETAKA